MKLSNTSQRRIILEELRRLDSHPTADELYEIVRHRMPQISLGTVYRNLELLSEDGQILKLQLTGKQKRFDGRTEDHYHMRCSGCERVMDICHDDMADVERKLDDLVVKMKLQGYSLELKGLCGYCRKEESKTGKDPV